jgi:NADPH:quinone reductase-like Zn-dependent oxidoreductase
MQVTKHHRVVVARRGGPAVLQVVEEDLPEPGAGEVRVRVLTAGVSALDLMLRSRSFPGFPRLPFTPGADVVGVVDELGDGVSTVDPGQRVAALLGVGSGGYAEFICLPASEAVPVPSGLDPAETVCVVANYLTAHAMIHWAAQVGRGERVLVHGAAGGVGTALLQLGKLATPIDYHTEDFVDRVRSLTGDGVDAVFDPIGGARQLSRSYRALRKGGRLVWFGVASSKENGVRVIPASLLTQFLLKLIPDGKKAPMAPNAAKPNDRYRNTLAELLDSLAAGRIEPVVEERIPLAEAARAHELLERGGHAGKVVLVADTGDA